MLIRLNMTVLFSGALLFVCLCFAAGDSAGEQPQKKIAPIGPGAIFHPDKDFLKTFHAGCDSLTYPKFGECFVSTMQKSGASPEAVAFAHLIDNTGYMRDFRDTGRVDVAYVTYPFRANENEGFFLVNGEPPLVNVDDLLSLPPQDINKDPRCRKIVRKYPKANLWPGERFRTTFPESFKLPGGIQRFTVTYWLKDGCRACQNLGVVLYAFDFDSSGKFLGRTFLKVVPTKTKK
ncbi:MAG: hypothetical protein WCU00_01525 [Candidatus Latescibacterota bacterium]|jgi:hypothetical protein